ncbi:MAG: hypothetical protein HQL36_01405 [Alphaproteobacteria bacterium]|nr:hypothetical protein [Alphaproteobacteria bacterium]MBF0249862.1 hypothetical protein [Alphaproteobacteria bacterium]
MGFYSNLPEDRPRSWYQEFRAEVVSDHRQLLACREERARRGDWSFDHARMRTQEFYRERITGYRRTESITQAECDELLELVEKLGAPEFPRD